MGYAWIFLDDAGYANVGLGYVCDGNFPLRINVGGRLPGIHREGIWLMSWPKETVPAGCVTGGWAGYSRPRARCAERILLVGDAANRRIH